MEEDGGTDSLVYSRDGGMYSLVYSRDGGESGGMNSLVYSKDDGGRWDVFSSLLQEWRRG